VFLHVGVQDVGNGVISDRKVIGVWNFL